MKSVMWTHDSAVIRPTDPAMRYKVFDDRGGEVAFITNTRASGRPSGWQISQVQAGRVTAEIGDYATADEALAALQAAFDGPSS